MDVAGRRALVVGLGISGYAAARALWERGARVAVTDASSEGPVEQRARQLRDLEIEVELGSHDLALRDPEFAVVSPGIPPKADVVMSLRARDVPLLGEVELAARLARCRFIAVTGTNGKTTTTQLVAAMLQEAGVATLAAGNIGFPLIDAITRVPPDGVVAVEVSSFQLELTQEFHPWVSVILNVAEDHTDWHSSFEAYTAAKARIVANQEATDIVVANREDEIAMSIAEGARARLVPFSWRDVPVGGVGRRGSQIVWREVPLFSVDDLAGGGIALLEDAMAAAAAVLECVPDPGAVERVVKTFHPLPHRMQLVATHDGIDYVNDSKATNPHATMSALRGLADVVLIAGGRSKGMDLGVLVAGIPPVTAVVALGEAADALRDAFEGRVPVRVVTNMDEAVRTATELAAGKGTVLLSPACASLDMYSSYSERGDDFVRCVDSVIAASGGAHGNA